MIPFTVGGGIRSAQDVEKLLRAGADKVAVNTAAVASPSLLQDISKRFGQQCTVLAIDAAKTSEGYWEVVTHGGRTRTGKNAIQWMQEAEQLGAGEILLTSWDHDGTRAGYDLEQLQAFSQATALPIIASGGANAPFDMVEAFRCGADAVLAASIFHDGEWDVQGIKAELLRYDLPIRHEITQTTNFSQETTP